MLLSYPPVRMRLWLIAALLLASCDTREATVTVFAAASLGPAMEEVGRAFEASISGARVRIAVAGSHVLRRQIEAGAPADVFVAASPEHAEALGEQLETVRTLACTTPVVLVSRNSSVPSLADLAHADRLVVGTPEVPLGFYTDAMLARLPAEIRRGIEARIASRELDARQVLAKVMLGEADAAIVYRTDAERAGETLRAVAIEPELAVVARYVIGVLRGSDASELARRFAEFATAAEGQDILRAHGFEACE